MKIGLLHPGAMGATVGSALAAAGHDVYWATAGRSGATAERADAAGLRPLPDVASLAAACAAIISVCPPAAALAQARVVQQAGFSGIYVDANAVSPASARDIEAIVDGPFVDGGIVGPPATRPGTTRLYLSGPAAGEVAGWFDGSLLGVQVVPGAAGAASALKMCYAAYTKGTAALLLAIRALAEAEGVGAGLLEEWRRSQPDLVARSSAAGGTATKAWRFVGEMEEIAASFQDAGLPGGFHLAAAEVYRRVTDLRDVRDPELQQVLSRLLERPDV